MADEEMAIFVPGILSGFFAVAGTVFIISRGSYGVSTSYVQSANSFFVSMPSTSAVLSPFSFYGDIQNSFH
jgi:hypothetical protein